MRTFAGHPQSPGDQNNWIAVAAHQVRIYFTDQTHNFGKLLEHLRTKSTTTFDKAKLKEKTTTTSVNTQKTLGQVNLDFFFDYKIFPFHIMTSLTQWIHEHTQMQIGDTILQQVFIPPTKTFSQKIIFGVRVNNVIDEPDRMGFSYETTEGHVEKGESTFTVENSDGGLIFKIRTFSEPGNLLIRIVGPIFTVPYQAYCTREALENVKRQIEE